MAEKLWFFGEVKEGEVINSESGSLKEMLAEKMEGKPVKVQVEEMVYEGPDYDDISLNKMLKTLARMNEEKEGSQ